MRILFTGAGSFTGYWFATALAAAGHEVVATFRLAPDKYDGLRAQRVGAVARVCRPAVCSFGDPAFLDLVRAGPWDLLCHHAADVTNYRSPDFDVAAAVANNTRNIAAVLPALEAAGCNRVLLTGSVFESDEGAGEPPLRAFSPYGQSKAVTAQVFREHAGAAGMDLGKFVIPNPFGPFEEPRFTAFLIKSWYEGKTPAVATPAYVRDNIHVSLLAAAYGQFAKLLAGPGTSLSNADPGAPERNPKSEISLHPTGYAETQGAFAQRFARELSPRLGLPCKLELKVQRDFPEPRVRVNTDPPDTAALDWDEAKAWDELAAYYRATYGPKSGG